MTKRAASWWIVACLLCGCGEERAAEPAQPAEHHAHGEHERDEHAHHHGAHEAVPAATPLPDTSVWQLEGELRDSSDRVVSFATLRGKPTVMVMFYGTCTTVCPLLVRSAKEIEEALGAEKRNQVRFVLVTFDPGRDTPERLRALAAEDHLDPSRWLLLRGSDATTRELAVVLGVQYRRLADGNYSHSALVTLLDAEGRVATQVEGAGAPMEPILARLREMTTGAAGSAAAP